MHSFSSRFLAPLALLPILSLPGGASCTDYDIAEPSASSPNNCGITWETSLKNAIARASREHKPILHLQLFGKLTDALC